MNILKKNLRRDVWELTLPIVAEQAFMAVMGIVNAVLSSHINKEAAAAIGMIDSINTVFIALFTALAVGSTVVVAHYKGKNDVKSLRDASRQSFYVSLLISVFMSVLIWFTREPLLRLLFGTAEPVVFCDARRYFEITLLTYPLIAITAVIGGVLRGAGDTKTPAQVIIFMNILNLVFSYSLIYGFSFTVSGSTLGFSGFGITGAAWGIALARICGALILTNILAKNLHIVSFKQIFAFRFKKAILRSILNIGIPASIESLLFNGGKLITQIFIVGMGTEMTAANYIGFSLHSFMVVPGSALSIAATTMVGQNMGRNDSEGARQTLRYLATTGIVVLMMLNLLFCFPFARVLISLYTDSPEIIRTSAFVLRLTNLAMPFWSLGFILPAGLKGSGDAKYTLIVSMLSMWTVRIGLGYLLGVGLKIGLTGIWLGMIADWMVRALFFQLRLNGEKWRKHVVIGPG